MTIRFKLDKIYTWYTLWSEGGSPQGLALAHFYFSQGEDSLSLPPPYVADGNPFRRFLSLVV